MAISLAKQFPTDIENLHMQYRQSDNIDGTRNIAFLYKIGPGIAGQSFGVWVRYSLIDLIFLMESAVNVLDLQDFRKRYSLLQLQSEIARRNLVNRVHGLIGEYSVGFHSELVQIRSIDYVNAQGSSAPVFLMTVICENNWKDCEDRWR